jgi:hypothetical protein
MARKYKIKWAQPVMDIVNQMYEERKPKVYSKKKKTKKLF